ncbi:DUF3068 domain-containing protein [Dermacoccaceae bacterium W4C1]
MRKNLGLVLIGLGGFLLAAALVLMVWAPGKAQRVPLNTDEDTRLQGTAKYLDEPEVRVEAAQRNRAVPSDSTDDTVVFSVFTCLYRDPDNTLNNCPSEEKKNDEGQQYLIQAYPDAFAADRTTGEAKPNYTKLPAGDWKKHSGLVNKLPFDAQKKNYTMWDGVLGKTVPVVYKGEETLRGHTVYRYDVDAPTQKASFAAAGGEVTGTYMSDKTIWIDPATGAILNQTVHEVRKLDNGDNAIDLNYKFTDATVANKVDKAESDGRKLSIISKAPWFLLPIGVLLLIGGFLLRRNNERDDFEDDDYDDYDDYDGLDPEDSTLTEGAHRVPRG